MIIAIIRIPRPADPAAAAALEARFAERLPLVAQAPGFRGFELLRPVEGSDMYLSVSRWADRAAFDAWVQSSYNAQAHGRPAGEAGAPGGPPRTQVELYEVAGE
jgi:heme-degrading monooxygenase HmoA